MDAKRCRTGDAEKKTAPVKPKAEQARSGSSVEDYGEPKKGKGKNAKPVEPPKDYVHVRARRGQATDSHSLAERVTILAHGASIFLLLLFQFVEFVRGVLNSRKHWLIGEKRENQPEDEVSPGPCSRMQQGTISLLMVFFA